MADNDMPADADPVVRVVRGTPTPEELAALVGVVIARSRPVGGGGPARAGSEWVHRARPGAIALSGLPARPGPGAWRGSGLPR